MPSGSKTKANGKAEIDAKPNVAKGTAGKETDGKQDDVKASVARGTAAAAKDGSGIAEKVTAEKVTDGVKGIGRAASVAKVTDLRAEKNAAMVIDLLAAVNDVTAIVPRVGVNVVTVIAANRPAAAGISASYWKRSVNCAAKWPGCGRKSIN